MNKEKTKILKEKYAGSYTGKKREVKMKEKNDLELLREFKKTSGWSYYRLSISLGVHYQTIVGWFLGKYAPSSMALEKIQKFLKSIEKSEAQGELKG